jgi:hypothetical protein
MVPGGLVRVEVRCMMFAAGMATLLKANYAEFLESLSSAGVAAEP